MSALLRLLRGSRGHPLHPPFTDATIGAYTVASVLGILAVAGVSPVGTTSARWLVLLVALCLTVPTAVTGLADWLQITRGRRSGEPRPRTWSPWCPRRSSSWSP